MEVIPPTRWVFLHLLPILSDDLHHHHLLHHHDDHHQPPHQNQTYSVRTLYTKSSVIHQWVQASAARPVLWRQLLGRQSRTIHHRHTHTAQVS